METQDAPHEAATAGAAVEVSGLTVRYGAVLAVDAVDLTVSSGEVVGIVGPNGAGKTSLLECVEGLRRPSAGTVRVAGSDPATDRRRVTAHVGVQLQHSAFPTRARVDEMCRLFSSFYRAPADYRELLEQFGLTPHVRQPVTKLSGGQQQRLSLVLALLSRPRVVFLDELTTGLDPAARRGVWEGLRKRNDDGLTVVITSHYMDEVEHLCDRVVVMRDGRVVAEGSVGALIAAHAGTNERLVVDEVGDDSDLREALAALGPGVHVTPVGNRLQVDVTDPASRSAVTELLAQRRAVSRPIGASLEDVYLHLTGDRADSGQ